MPHKHRREKIRTDPSFWDLPPTKRPHSLPVKHATDPQESTKVQLKNGYKGNDTPRAFDRLFQPYRPPRSGQDDGERPSRKRKMQSSASTNEPLVTLKTGNGGSEALEILPHEPLSHFNARVDQSLPFASLSRDQSKPDPSLKSVSRPRKTKMERKMQKMQQAWREEDTRRRENMMAEGEDGEGAVDEENVEEMGAAPQSGVDKRTGKKRKAQKRSEDIWRSVGAKKQEIHAHRQGEIGLVGLHNVVQAPPRFNKKSRDGTDGFRVKHGGLKKQSELSEARHSVIEGYRAMMKQRREGIGVS